jgi:uncharacterized protein (TIGR02118 family)
MAEWPELPRVGELIRLPLPLPPGLIAAQPRDLWEIADRGVQPMRGETTMVKLMVLYGKPTDTGAFDAYYASTHAPLAEKLPGLRRFEHGKSLDAGDGSEAPYYYVAELSFDDAEALEAGRASPEGQAAAGDLDNFASGGVTIFVAQA